MAQIEYPSKSKLLDARAKLETKVRDALAANYAAAAKSPLEGDLGAFLKSYLSGAPGSELNAFSDVVTGALYKDISAFIDNFEENFEVELPGDRATVGKLQIAKQIFLWRQLRRLCVWATLLRAFVDDKEQRLWDADLSSPKPQGYYLLDRLAKNADALRSHPWYVDAAKGAASDDALSTYFGFSSAQGYPIAAELKRVVDTAKTIARRYATIHVAWTFDDGPTLFSDRMRAAFRKATGDQPMTWYVVRANAEDPTRGGLPRLKKLQDDGDEIALHAMHKADAKNPKKRHEHVAWFPAPCEKGGECYPNVKEAMDDFKAFRDLLEGTGIRIKFTRFPYGLFTELLRYLGKKGFSTKEVNRAYPEIDPIVNNLIKRDNKYKVPKTPHDATDVQKDFDYIFNRLDAWSVHEWGGKASGGLSRQSWETESSGVPKRSNGVLADFEKSVARMITDRRRGSLVVLTHELTPEDIDAMVKNIAGMHKFAADHGVTVRYHTMSDLYQILTRKRP